MANISDYREMSDWTPILASLLFLEAMLIFWFRLAPSFWGKDINVWYDRFGWLAVLADLLIVAIGFFLARYLYTWLFADRFGWNIWLFLVLFLAIQIIHDFLFYVGVIRQMSRGTNAMIDVMQDYATQVGWKAIAGDSMMVVLMTIMAAWLRGLPLHVSVSVGIIGGYLLPYALTTSTFSAPAAVQAVAPPSVF